MVTLVASLAFLLPFSAFACPVAPRGIDLAASKTGPEWVEAGQILTYEVTVTNNNPGKTTFYQLIDPIPIPAGLLYRPADSHPACSEIGTNIVCTNVSINTTDTYALVFDVPDDFTCPSDIDNFAAVFGTTTDPNMSNNQSNTVTTTIKCPTSDLSIVKSGASAVAPGEQVQYTLTIANEGKLTPNDVTITDPVPTGLIFNAGASDPKCSWNSGVVTCGDFTLAPDQTKDVHLVFHIDPNMTCNDTIENQATITSSVQDSNQSNNTSNVVSTTVDCSLQQCKDGQDNDGDGLIDLNDPGCEDQDDPSEDDPNGPKCDNGLDDDGDGLVDFPADPGCHSVTDNDERDSQGPQCDDGLDNDGDGLTDVGADPGCSDANDDDERDANGAACDNGLDDDGDGWTDFPEDTGCESPFDDTEENPTGPQCDNGIDDDGDGWTDFPEDAGCDSPSDDKETNPTGPQCDDGLDNDGDGKIDILDPDCSGPSDPTEGNRPQCDDYQDNDGDGLVDLEDPGCIAVIDNDESDDTSQCQDSVDNDHDGAVDFPADPDCDSPQDNSEFAVTACQGILTPLFNVPDLQSVVIYEQTGNVTSYAFGISDGRLTQDIQEGPANSDFDTQQGDPEYYDVFVSDKSGRLDANGSFLTIQAVTNSTLDNDSASHNIDAVELVLRNGQKLYADQVVRVELGANVNFHHFVSSHGYANRSLGAPNNLSTRLGNQFASLTVGFCAVTAEPAACNDGIDNDGDGFADFEVHPLCPGCAPGTPPEQCVCRGDPGCTSENDNSEKDANGPQCDNDRDDDGDGLVDFPNDPDCTGPADTREGTNTACSDGLDNDGDGLTDHNDPGCANPDDNTEYDPNGPQCDNGRDDDGDGDTDFAQDLGCQSPADDSEVDARGPACDNGQDDDGDGVIDFAQDPGCSHPDDDTETNPNGPACDNGLDDDGDNLVDTNDPGCSGPQDSNEINPSGPQCDNGRDDDNDGLTDTQDPDCSGPQDTTESPLSACADGLDNDGDGLTDLSDPGCANAHDDSETDPNGAACDNGLDDDGDGLTDSLDPGCSHPHDNEEHNPHGLICDNGRDDDGDGLADLADPGCDDIYDTSEKGLEACDNGLDDDEDGTIDFQVDGSGDAECSSVYDQDEVDSGTSSSSNNSSSTSSSTSSAGNSSSSAGEPNHTLELSDSKDPVAPGETFTYSVKVTNLESHNIVKSSVVLALDSDVTYLTANFNGTHSNGVVRWENIPISANGTVTLTATVKVDTDARDGTILISNAFGSPTDEETTRVEIPDNNPTDDDIKISISDDRDPVEPGAIITYTIRVSNEGDQDTEVDVKAFLDNDTIFLSASDDGDDVEDDEVEWEDVEVDADDTEKLTLRVKVSQRADDGQHVRLKVRASDDEDEEKTLVEEFFGYEFGGGGFGAGVPDPNVNFGGPASVSLQKQADKREVQPGSTVTYTLTLRNLSNHSANDLLVSDSFDTGSLSIEEAGGGNVSGNRIEWAVPVLAANESRVLRYRARVSSTLRHGQTVRNTALVNGRDLDRSATDSYDLRVIEQLPQTGSLSGFTVSATQGTAYLRPVKQSAEGATAAATFWTIISFAGLGAGSLIGRRLFF